LTSPAIFDLLRHVRWSSWHFLSSLRNLFVPLAGSVAEASRRWIKRRNARRAQSWPSVEGRVQAINVVTGTKFFGSPRQHNAIFTYSYFVHKGSETNYYSGDFRAHFLRPIAVGSGCALSKTSAFGCMSNRKSRRSR
jgi:hypothetical protein